MYSSEQHNKILELPPSHTHRLDVAETVCVVGGGGGRGGGSGTVEQGGSSVVSQAGEQDDEQFQKNILELSSSHTHRLDATEAV